MSRARGLALQNALARYLQAWWPHAESAGAGRNGRDILGTPGVAWECKTSLAGTSPSAVVRQAVANAHGDIPIVAYWPPGVGAARPQEVIAMMPLGIALYLLDKAGYAPVPERKDQAS